MELAGNLKNIKEVCILTHLSRRSIYKRIEAGLFPKPILPSKKNLWHISQIEEYLQQQVDKSKE